MKQQDWKVQKFVLKSDRVEAKRYLVQFVLQKGYINEKKIHAPVVADWSNCSRRL